MKHIQQSTSILLLLFLTISVSFANIAPNQDGKIYVGFIITASGDTLHGKLEMLSPTMNQVKIKFIDKDEKKELYKAKDLNAYAFKVEVWNKESQQNDEKWIYYTKKTVERPPVPFASTEVLMQQEVVGLISVYNYYIETRVEQNMEHIIYVEKDKVLYEVNKENYKDVLRELMVDFPFMKEKVGTKGYTFNALETTVKEYNQQAKPDMETVEK